MMSKCEVHHASGDADLLIVQKAVESTRRVNTVLVGDDTDLLVCCAIMQVWILISYILSQSQKWAPRIQECGTLRPPRNS